MTTAPPDIRALSRSAPDAAPAVPPPRSRWMTRVLLPLAIIALAAALLIYAARDALRPALAVRVVPVVARTEAPGAGSSAPSGAALAVLVQAPGWIEADPYAITVPALVEGVVEEVLVLEGQRVEQGQVVARLVDEDARLAVQRAEAEVAAMEAELQRARAEAAAAEARVAEIRDELTRKRPLIETGGVSEGQIARLELRLRAAEREHEAARAAITLAEANVGRARVEADTARLALTRTRVVAPASGVVMARLVEPGARLSMTSGTGMTGGIVRLYDPSRLQVRTDIPIGDAAKVGVGTPAQVTTEALPDRVFTGRVTRLVHEADIQRNTVQVKVAIDDPDPTLKPEMLARVRFLGGGGDGGAGQPSAGGGLTLLIPQSAVRTTHEGRGLVWVADLSGGATGPIAAEREIAYRPADAGHLAVTSGLSPGDRVIVDPPPALAAGARVRIVGEHASDNHEGASRP